MEALKVPEHVHPLKLIDLQLEYPQYEEEEDDDDDDGDRIKREGFSQVACDRCSQMISIYHLYYYKCSSCHFSLHKFCGELPSRLEHALHPHPLFLLPNSSTILSLFSDDRCKICKSDHDYGEWWYMCLECRFFIDMKCAVEVGKNIIHHPCHPHSLICAISHPILCNCKACGKEHKGVFYQCTTCVGFTIHSECAFLPKTLQIQDTTNDAFYHTHPLTISYSFPRKDQEAKHEPRCRVCGDDFYGVENLWIYKCDKCMYYAHVDCATSRREPFMSILSYAGGYGKTYKNYNDIDYRYILHLPFPDETYSIPKYWFFQESGTSGEVNLKHISHEHTLILIDQTQCNEKYASKVHSRLVLCHNPMKKTQLLCNGCLRPIMSTMLFYKCAQNCSFALHEWCTHLPTEIESHPGHPHHTLRLMYPNELPCFFGVFDCNVCDLPCNGFAYCCVRCEYYVDVTCGFLPEQITHKAHLNHLLSLIQEKYYPNIGGFHRRIRANSYRLYYNCKLCDFYMLPECALLLAETMRHKYDKHPMRLSYLPIENHKSEYFCEICEEDLNPHEYFYHCQDCVQSVHGACAPSILESETETYNGKRRNVHFFANIKFGGIHTGFHQHPLSFAQSIVSDGRCGICHELLYYAMIFKCIECRFAIHYKCLKEQYYV